jgi:MFS family permease
LIADITSDVGTFMQSVGAAWLMLSLGAGPFYVALVQSASALPFFLLALPAGAIGDIVDRRKLVLFTETWMVCVALVLAGVTLSGRISPILLLVLTFALAAGDALETPTWRAILPEVVPRGELPAASALNGVEFNFARAVGPGLAGLLIAAAGVGAAFLVNAASFLGVILVVARWKRPRRQRTAPGETFGGATVAALRYVRHAPTIRVLLVRGGVVMFFASALLALLPSIARSVSTSPVGYGLLLGCFGLGAVLGAMAMQRARARWSTEVVVSGGVVVFGLTTAAAATLRLPLAIGLVMVAAGAAWIVFISLVNVLVQSYAPDWVRARVLAVSMLSFQGAAAAGSAAWGALAARAGVPTALLWAAVGTIATTALGLVYRLPGLNVDVTPWNHWRLPSVIEGDPAANEDGPVLVTVEYRIDREHVAGFIETMHEFARVRRRDGATRWGVYRDLEHKERYLETFIVDSWGEHLRQHERLTEADRELESRIHRYLKGVEPKVRHLLYVDPSA